MAVPAALPESRCVEIRKGRPANKKTACSQRKEQAVKFVFDIGAPKRRLPWLHASWGVLLAVFGGLDPLFQACLVPGSRVLVDDFVRTRFVQFDFGGREFFLGGIQIPCINGCVHLFDLGA